MLAKPQFRFNGNAQEAINFYKVVFNAKISDVVRYKDMMNDPQCPPFEEKDKDKLLNARLTIDNSQINFTDDLDTSRLVRTGDNITMDLVIKEETEVNHIFNALAEGGTIIEPLSALSWTPNIGVVTDKFGILWCIMQLDA